MYNKQGDSIIVDNQKVHNHLKMGWTFQPPKQVEKPKMTKKTSRAKDVIDAIEKSMDKQQQEEPAESTLVLEAEATAEVIKPNKKEN